MAFYPIYIGKIFDIMVSEGTVTAKEREVFQKWQTALQ